ncbi:MAG: hypothetical protein ACKKL5_00795 [Candidatus Komeilibacteria bacterium]
MKKLYLTIFLCLAFFIFIPNAQAVHDPFNTDFADYITGNVNNQNNWTSSNGALIVENGSDKYLHNWATASTVYTASYDPSADLSSYASTWYLGGHFKTTATGSAWRMTIRDNVNSTVFLIEFNEANGGELSVIGKTYYFDQTQVISLLTGINDSDWGLIINDYGAYYTISAIGGNTTPEIVGYSCSGSCSIEKFTFSQVGTRTEPSFLDLYYMLYSDPSLPAFYIASPEQDEYLLADFITTVSGYCPTNGVNRIGLTNSCTGFDSIVYNIDCVDNQFSGEIFKARGQDFIIAREIDSISTDCVNYDDLMYMVGVHDFDLVYDEGEVWYQNMDYYSGYDIEIASPDFDQALLLPNGTTNTDVTFNFTYPADRLSFLTFNIKQYLDDGTLLDENYYTENLSNMTDTSNHTVNLEASSTRYHYIVQLLDDSVVKRQYPFSVRVSDLDFIYSESDGYFFPRLVNTLKTKVVFAYYFAFYDGFTNLFNYDFGQASPDALNITFKSVSDNGEYDLDVPVFSFDDERVISFTQSIRPYVVAILWLIFAMYVIFRITHLFSDNE